MAFKCESFKVGVAFNCVTFKVVLGKIMLGVSFHAKRAIGGSGIVIGCHSFVCCVGCHS